MYSKQNTVLGIIPPSWPKMVRKSKFLNIKSQQLKYKRKSFPQPFSNRIQIWRIKVRLNLKRMNQKLLRRNKNLVPLQILICHLTISRRNWIGYHFQWIWEMRKWVSNNRSDSWIWYMIIKLFSVCMMRIWVYVIGWNILYQLLQINQFIFHIELLQCNWKQKFKNVWILGFSKVLSDLLIVLMHLKLW